MLELRAPLESRGASSEAYLLCTWLTALTHSFLNLVIRYLILEKYSAQHQRAYWRNNITGVSTWARPPITARTTPLASHLVLAQGTGDGGGAANPLFEMDTIGGAIDQPQVIESPLTLDDIFSEIDVDQSGQIQIAEFITWWTQNGGAVSEVPLFEQCFASIGQDDGIQGVSLSEFRRVLCAVAANDWLEKQHPEHSRSFWWNKRTGESSWADPGGPERVEECVREWLQRVAGIRHRVQELEI